MIKGLYILLPDAYDRIYGPAERDQIARHVDIYADPQTNETIKQNLSLLADAEVIFSGWGGPKLDAEFLDAAKNLKVVFYGAGSIRGIVSDEFWHRGIRITSAAAANAVPVAEFTVSQILFSLKRGWQHVMKVVRRQAAEWRHVPVPGAFGTKVGIVSLGEIGRIVCEKLATFDMKVMAYDPFVADSVFEQLGVERCELAELFSQCDVVSLHSPNLPETQGMITGEHFALMKKDTTFINTARGAIVREDEMIEVLTRRPDIWAVLDVTHPEPPEADSPLYTLENVILTPHIAGSMGLECRRMARYMVQELYRYLAGEPLRWEVTHEKFQNMA
jgi:phosphoglycerate dehydrogenase-like enzyme